MGPRTEDFRDIDLAGDEVHRAMLAISQEQFALLPYDNPVLYFYVAHLAPFFIYQNGFQSDSAI